ncbi:hypothetical protein [Oricola cellulosilytica]|uniref:Uncharacterized protein n=1 Tax=Oricola cellulosilytica TaxID=1429082 RepID=A0A4R0P8Q4_9HYPH|nr:hypothetical protein [Oricola cellulosilytica]TCD13463.1 hypothetical protein E0D97_13370 [Oricola cellulosilytica]
MTDKSIQDELAHRRDELRLQLHLASMEAKEEWDELTHEWDKFVSRSQLDKSAEEVGEAARHLGLKLKTAFDRMHKGKG